MLSASGPIRKAGGKGAVCLRPDTKSLRGEGGGGREGCCVVRRFRPDTKRGELLSRRGGRYLK